MRPGRPTAGSRASSEQPPTRYLEAAVYITSINTSVEEVVHERGQADEERWGGLRGAGAALELNPGLFIGAIVPLVFAGTFGIPAGRRKKFQTDNQTYIMMQQ